MESLCRGSARAPYVFALEAGRAASQSGNEAAMREFLTRGIEEALRRDAQWMRDFTIRIVTIADGPLRTDIKAALVSDHGIAMFLQDRVVQLVQGEVPRLQRQAQALVALLDGHPDAVRDAKQFEEMGLKAGGEQERRFLLGAAEIWRQMAHDDLAVATSLAAIKGVATAERNLVGGIVNDAAYQQRYPAQVTGLKDQLSRFDDFVTSVMPGEAKAGLQAAHDNDETSRVEGLAAPLPSNAE